MNKSNKNSNSIMVISAINFFEGGPLSILKDCLAYLNESEYVDKYKVIAMVHKTSVLDISLYPRIEFLEYPKSRESYLWRLYYEYFYFRRWSANQNIRFWLSLHDITPNIGDIEQAVYCHNPSPFNKITIKDIYLQPTQFFFRMFYKYLYQINIKRNKYVIVQQLWMKKRFIEMFSLSERQIIVAKPQIETISKEFINQQLNTDITFFFPTFPRAFKNIEVICEAAKILNSRNITKFSIVVTIDGTENNYASFIVNKYQFLSTVKFVGVLPRYEVFRIYGISHCLLFPSKLETWGLPISEFKQFGKPMIVADLPYARETAGNYENVDFFNPEDPVGLACLMAKIVHGEKLSNPGNDSFQYNYPFADNWHELFNILIS